MRILKSKILTLALSSRVIIFLICTLQLLSQPADIQKSHHCITIAAVGDIMVHDAQLESAWNLQTNAYDFKPVFESILQYLQNVNLTIGNLETTLPGKKSHYSGYPQFGAPDELAIALKYAGFDILTTANNHACDKGPLGFFRTLDVLDSLKINHLGTYRNHVDYKKDRIQIIYCKGFKLAFLNYTYALNGMPVPDGAKVNMIRRKQMAKDIATAKLLGTDAIIVIFHAGKEYNRMPDDYQKRNIQFLIDEGVDVVLGGHPHVLQPFELKMDTGKDGITKPRLIAWSLGNFLSNQRERYRDGGIILYFSLEKHNQKMMIKDIYYEPVYVHVERSKTGNKHVLLPVRQYISHRGPVNLSQEDYNKMMTFYRDTKSHLSKSMKQVSRFEREHYYNP